jgi:hypothetical protein
VPAASSVTGTLGAAVSSNDTVEPVVVTTESVQKLLGSKLFFGTFEAQLRSIWQLKLTDAAHIGKTMGVSP